MSTQSLAGQTPSAVDGEPRIADEMTIALGRGAEPRNYLPAAHLAFVQETDHRVKNTIQSVASLLMLQARTCAAPEARAALEDATRRLGVFARVHELLRCNRMGDREVGLGEVIETLATALRAVFSDRVALRVVADHVMVDPEMAIPLSLLVNEAITNAYKHAYPDGRPGEIFVRVAKTGSGGLRVGIQDDGVGFAPDVRQGSLGLTLMHTFATQLGGILSVVSDDGTTILLTVSGEMGTYSPQRLGEGNAT